jgi:hypothetical protein
MKGRLKAGDGTSVAAHSLIEIDYTPGYDSEISNGLSLQPFFPFSPQTLEPEL